MLRRPSDSQDSRQVRPESAKKTKKVQISKAKKNGFNTTKSTNVCTTVIKAKAHPHLTEAGN